MSDTAGTGLKRGALGTPGIVFIVVSAAAPLMVMVGVAPIAFLVAGVSAPTIYLAAGITLTVFAVGFTTMARHVTNAGGFYAYIALGLGKGAGTVAALLALFSYNALEIGVFGLLGVSANATFADVFGLDLPWYVWALAGVALVWFLGFRSVDVGAKVLAVLVTAETALLLMLAVAVLAQGGADGIHFDSFHPSNFLTAETGTALPIAFAAFMGFESTVIYRAEARDPERTIPRATYLAVALLAVVYGFIVWSVVQAFGADGIVPTAASDPVGLVFAATDIYLGGWATTLMQILMVSSIVASLLAFHNAITRYTRAIAEEGMLPSALAAVHPSTGSPYIAGVAQTALAAAVVAGFAVAGADPFAHLLIWVNTPGVLGILLLQVLAAIAVPAYFIRSAHDESAWRTRVAPLLAAAAMIGALCVTVTHLELITAASDAVNLVLMLSVVAVCACGVVWALWLRRNRPEVYAAIATEADEGISGDLVR
ncbi:MAG: APC family permease [Nocardioides sp.]|uniref:APC family permease n=1 Tax=Nocardioides sp. TaxID=35761 RepID=UPI003263148F